MCLVYFTSLLLLTLLVQEQLLLHQCECWMISMYSRWPLLLHGTTYRSQGSLADLVLPKFSSEMVRVYPLVRPALQQSWTTVHEGAVYFMWVQWILLTFKLTECRSLLFVGQLFIFALILVINIVFTYRVMLTMMKHRRYTHLEMMYCYFFNGPI